MPRAQVRMALPESVSRDAFLDAVDAGSDVSLLLDAEGTVLEVIASGDHAEQAEAEWPGRRWADLVTVESRRKVEELLAPPPEAVSDRPRHINHAMPGRPDAALAYTVMPISGTDLRLATGRDLAPIAKLQQQLVRAQQALEADYERLRHAETRYRVLFRMTSDGVVTVDAASRRITDANPAASDILGLVADRATGRRFPEGFEPESARALEAMLELARTTGAAGETRVRMAGDPREYRASAALFREGPASLVLVRLAPAESSGERNDGRPSLTEDLVRLLPDGFVVTEEDGRIVVANDAALDLLQLPSEEAARRASLDRYLGRLDIDFDVLAASLRERGAVRLFATTVEGARGGKAEVEISGAAADPDQRPGADRAAYGFLIREVGRRLAPAASTAEPLATLDQLAEQVGRAPLKDIVGEMDELIERQCIKAALRLTGDNRAAAAELLGLSRQSLYVKLRRYGMEDEAGEGGA